MGWVHGVTTDGAVTWSIWNAEKDLPNWACCNYGLIQEVHIAADGHGIMNLNPIPQRQGEVSHLETKDFGMHWTGM